MYSTVNNGGEVRPVATPVVHDRTTTYTSIPESEARARRIAAEAARWLAFATERTTMKSTVLTAKALDSVAFSVAAGASGFAVPTKLVAVREHQSRLWGLVRAGYDRYAELALNTVTTDGVAVTLDDETLGEVQPKHHAWVRPLVPFGLRMYISRITGHETRGHSIGVNVVVGGVGRAIAALAVALGTEAARSSGDGARSTVFPVPALPSRPKVPSGDGASGDGATGRLRLVVPPEAPVADPGDIVLVRGIDGTARATVAHTPVHSPTGIDWGRLGAGPTDLALAVLTAVAGADVAERHSADFAIEVVARLPYAGGVLRAADVRRWLVRQHA